MADSTEPVVRRLLATVRVASPCPESWEQMTGDDRVRSCDRCAKQVYDLSAMTADEAEAALGDPAVQCVRFYRRVDGRIMTSDCPDAPRRRRQRRVAVMAGAAMAAGMAGGAAAAWTMRQPARAPVEPCPAEAVEVANDTVAPTPVAPADEPTGELTDELTDEPTDELIEPEATMGQMVVHPKPEMDMYLGFK